MCSRLDAVQALPLEDPPTSTHAVQVASSVCGHIHGVDAARSIRREVLSFCVSSPLLYGRFSFCYVYVSSDYCTNMRASVCEPHITLMNLSLSASTK